MTSVKNDHAQTKLKKMNKNSFLLRPSIDKISNKF